MTRAVCIGREGRAASRPAARRRAGVYVIVLVVVAVVVAIVLMGGLVDRTLRRTGRINTDALVARNLATSGLNLGMEMVRASNWRSTRAANGTWLTGAAFGAGSVDLRATDPIDGNFNSNTTDPIVLTATGRAGDARQMLRLALQADFEPMSCATGALHCGGALTFSSGSRVVAAGTVSTNLSIVATTATVNAPAEAATTITGTTFASTQTPLAGTRTIPDATVINNFPATTILYSSLPSGRLEQCVLSPGSNPFGAVSPTGTYLIDCGGSNLNIRNLRIVGTLIIRNAGSTSSISGMVNWEPAVPNQPALLWVGGNLFINLTDGRLTEGSANLNPASTPYRGVSDIDTSDTYPNIIRGIVYTSGNLAIAGTVTLQGVLIALGSASFSSTAVLTVTSDPVISTDPPLGFRTGPTMIVVPGSWAQVVE